MLVEHDISPLKNQNFLTDMDWKFVLSTWETSPVFFKKSLKSTNPHAVLLILLHKASFSGMVTWFDFSFF